MDAVIMTGGKGLRLSPYTKILPKGLLPVGGQPMLETIVMQLAAWGFQNITMICGHLAPLIQTYFGDGHQFGVKLSYLVEEKPLGTAGSLKQLEHLHDPFLVINCDVLTSLNLHELIQFHRAHDGLLTIASQEKHIPVKLGVLQVDEDEVVDFQEKPDHVVRVSMGIYLMNPGIRSFIPANQYFDIPDLIRALLTHKEPVHHYDNDAFWLDIGTPDDYNEATRQFETVYPLLFPGEVNAHDA